MWLWLVMLGSTGFFPHELAERLPYQQHLSRHPWVPDAEGGTITLHSDGTLQFQKCFDVRNGFSGHSQ